MHSSIQAGEAADREAGADARVLARTGWLVALSAALICCALLIQVWARTFLYADGAFYVFWVVDTGAPIDFDPPRRFAQWLTQYPLVLASRLAAWRLPALARVFGLAVLFAPYCLSLAACAYALRRRPLLILFPIASLATAGLNSSLFIVSESHFLAAVFWPLVCFLVADRKPTWLSWVLIAACGVPTLRSYETMALQGLFLAALAAWRALEARYSLAERMAFLACAAWFLAGAAVGAYWIVHPRVPENRTAFLSSLVRSVSEAGHLNLPLLATIVSLGLLVLPLLMRSMRGSSYLPLAAVVVLGLAVAQLVIDPNTLYPLFHYRARVLNFVVPIALAAAFLAAYWRYPRIDPLTWQRSALTLAFLALAQLFASSLIARDWHRYEMAIRGQLAARSGLIPLEEASVSRSPELAKWNFEWTMSTLSLILAPSGRVNALIDNSKQWNGWVPFDPRNATELPRLERQGVDWSAYQQSLAPKR